MESQGQFIQITSTSTPSYFHYIAENMRKTLIEVLGSDKGKSMYSLEWLVQRAQQHVDGTLEGFILGFEINNKIRAHIMGRIECNDKGSYGLVSTIYVDPCLRRSQMGSKLLSQAEKRLMENDSVRFIRTYTDQNNEPLIGLMLRNGYQKESVSTEKEMICLSKDTEAMGLRG